LSYASLNEMRAHDDPTPRPKT